MMIIQIFDFPDYPMKPRTNLNWSNMPIGYFTCDPRKLKDLKSHNVLSVDGTFHYHPNKDSMRPTTGDTVLAAFTFDRVRYIYRANLRIPDFQNLRKTVFDYSWLNLAKEIKNW